MATSVQANTQASSGTVTSFAVTLPVGVAQGNLLVCVFACGATGVTITPPTGWTQAVSNSPASGGSSETAIFYKVVDSGSAGQTSWTFTLSASHSVYTTVREWNSPYGWPSSPVDQTAVGETEVTPTTNTHIDSGTTSTTVQNVELWVAGLTYKGSAQTESNVTSGWTVGGESTQSGNTTSRELYQSVTSTGAADVSFDIGVDEFWSGCVATFKEGASGAPVPISDSGVGVDDASQQSVTFTLPDTGHGTDSTNVQDAATTYVNLTETGVGSEVLSLNLAANFVPSGSQVPVAGTPSYGPPGIPLAERYVASWSIRVLNASRQVTGALTGYRKFSAALRYNTVSDWAIELDASDPQVANLLVPGYGISASRTVRDLYTGKVVSNRVEIAGPLRKMSRTYVGDTLIVSGKDWMFYLLSELALPVTTYPYATQTSQPGSLQRYYRANETTGATTFADASGVGANMTLGAGSATSLSPGGIDDADTALSFTAGAWARATTTTGLPTGNAVWSMRIWIYLPVAPGAGTSIAGFAGASGTAATPQFYFPTTSTVTLATGSYDTPSAGITTGTWHQLGGVWNGTTLRFFLDGVFVGSNTGTAMAIQANPAVVVGGRPLGTATPSPLMSTAFSWDEFAIWSVALTDAQMQTDYNVGFSRFAASYSDAQTGNAETVIKHYVSANVASTATFTERRVSGLVVTASSNRGSTVTGNARFDKLVLLDGTGLLQQLALSGGVGMSLGLVSGTLTFDCYTPIDRTASVIFSSDLGNVLDFSWERSGPDPSQGGNVVYVGGGQQAQDRIFVTRTDPGSIASWGRAEFFQDARDTTDIPTLQQRGDAVLSASKETQQYAVTIQPNVGMVYGINFNLGDKVTSVVDGQVFQDLIREVDITLDQNQTEVVTPLMGTPNAVLVRDASIALHRKLASQVNTLTTLQNRT